MDASSAVGGRDQRSRRDSGFPEAFHCYRMSLEEYESLTPHAERLAENWVNPLDNPNIFRQRMRTLREVYVRG